MYAPTDTATGGRRFSPAAPPWRRGLWAALLAVTPLAYGSAVPAHEDWYSIAIDGQPAGWAVEREERRGDEIVSESRARLELSRGTAVLALELESRFVESPDGRPLRAATRQQLGAQPIAAEYRFTADGIVLPGGGEQPLPGGDWLTPAQMRRRIREEVAGGAEEFSLRTLDLQLGVEPVTIRWVLEERGEELTVGGKTYLASRWRQTTSVQPQTASVVHVDAAGRTLRSATQMMGMNVVQELSSQAAVTGRAIAAPELLVRLFVRPDRAIERPRRLRRAVYEVTAADGTAPELPSVGAQRAERRDAATRVVVERGASTPAPDADVEELLRSTVFVPHDDPRIRELLELAWKDGVPDDAAARAETLRAFVAGFVEEKDLDTGLATAAEVAATRSGDCTEHAVLLAALLRAAGIPARGVVGLIYAESFAGESRIFVYHMWTQALLDGRWVELDATLPEPFDAAHIALGTWTLADGASVQELSAVADLMDRLAIRVLETEP